MIKNEQNNYINIQNGEVLDWNKVKQLPDNAMLKVRPELWEIWYFEKNDKLGLDIWKMKKGSQKNAWWYCDRCESIYDCELKKKNEGNSCPYCTGKRVNHTNSLVSLNPSLAKEWHPTKNGELTPHNVTCGSGKKVWWYGKCGHEWESQIRSRTEGKSCPYCTTKAPKVLKGFNDMWTVNSKLASLLLNPKDGYKYGEFSNKKADWKCNCGEIIKDKRIHMINKRGLDCPNCSESISYPEKVVYCLLRKLNITSNKEKTFDWSKSKRYDYYIPSLDIIIEVHGLQHYKGGFECMGGRDLECEKLNDHYKRELALQNGITHYIELNCSKSELEFIKNSIMNSELVELLGVKEEHFDGLETDIEDSLVITVWNLWDSGMKNIDDISNKLNLDNYTIHKYLNRRKVS